MVRQAHMTIVTLSLSRGGFPFSPTVDALRLGNDTNINDKIILTGVTVNQRGNVSCG